MAIFAAAFGNKHEGASNTNITEWGTASKLILPIVAPRGFDTRSVLLNAWLANTPQIFLSALYFSINRLCTSLCFAREWNEYAIKRRSLRVTYPRSEQQGTHFLQLPYRWAIRLILTSAVLHWLSSQSLFLMRFEHRDVEGNLYPTSTCSRGYSTLSFLVFSLILWGLLMTVLALMLRRLRISIPISAHCSTIISAACHPPPTDSGCERRKVK